MMKKIKSVNSIRLRALSSMYKTPKTFIPFYFLLNNRFLFHPSSLPFGLCCMFVHLFMAMIRHEKIATFDICFAFGNSKLGNSSCYAPPNMQLDWIKPIHRKTCSIFKSDLLTGCPCGAWRRGLTSGPYMLTWFLRKLLKMSSFVNKRGW